MRSTWTAGGSASETAAAGSKVQCLGEKKNKKKKHSKRKQMLKIKQFAGHDTFNQLWVTVGPSVCGCVGV